MASDEACRPRFFAHGLIISVILRLTPTLLYFLYQLYSNELEGLFFPTSPRRADTLSITRSRVFLEHGCASSSSGVK